MDGGDASGPNIYLVRHAVAKGRSQWKGADNDRPLTKKGEREARGLVEVLAGANIGRILSSPAKRCIDTIGPAADILGVAIEPADELLEDAPVEKTYDLLLEQARRTVDCVLCTHGDNITELVDVLRRNGVRFHGRLRWSKGSTWVITVKDGRPHRARYVPPRQA